MAMRESVRKVGQRFMVGFDGHEASADVKRLIREYGVGHLIYFARNIASPEQVAELSRELQETARDAGHDLPLVIGVDQEGGRVARMGPPWTVWPLLEKRGPDLGETDDLPSERDCAPSLALRVSRAVDPLVMLTYEPDRLPQVLERFQDAGARYTVLSQ